jgi:hypothetical protein
MNKVGGMSLKEFDVQTKQHQGEYQNLIEFIGESQEYSTYLHTTNSETNAKSICNNGLRYEVFQKTTDRISHVDGLIYMLMIREPYGNFTIIIQINASIHDYESISKKVIDVDIPIEHSDNNEIFILPPQYIKGYYNRTTREIFENPLFRK